MIGDSDALQSAISAGLNEKARVGQPIGVGDAIASSPVAVTRHMHLQIATVEMCAFVHLVHSVVGEPSLVQNGTAQQSGPCIDSQGSIPVVRYRGHELRHLFFGQVGLFRGNKALAEPAVRFCTKLYLQPFTLEETLEYAHSALNLSPHTSAAVAGWLHERTLGHPYFLAFVCKHLSATVSRIEPRALEPTWPVIFDQLGREKFALDVSQLSTKELDLIHQFAIMGQSELAPHNFRGKFQREYFARLAGKGLLIRAGRGRYTLYHPLFREFLRQTE